MLSIFFKNITTDMHISKFITVLLNSNLNKSLLDQYQPTVNTLHSTSKCHKDIVL